MSACAITGISIIKVLQPFDYINILLQESGKILAGVDFEVGASRRSKWPSIMWVAPMGISMRRFLSVEDTMLDAFRDIAL